MTLTDFLLARIAEDEAAARTGMGQQKSFAFPNISGGTSTLTLHHEGPFAPARVLAECEAKRRIVQIHYNERGHGRCKVCMDDMEHPRDWEREPWPCPTIRALAAVYADHPDYDTAWTP